MTYRPESLPVKDLVPVVQPDGSTLFQVEEDDFLAGVAPNCQIDETCESCQ